MDDSDIVRRHVGNYIRQRLEANPEALWNEDHFAVEPLPDAFVPLLKTLGIGPGTRVLHTHTTSSHYADLLKRAGADVETYDISLASALRSGARVRDATRLFEWGALRSRYDSALSFEPAQFFHVSGSVIGAASLMASYMHAVRKGGPIYVIARSGYGGGTPADNFDAVFAWMRKHFGLDYGYAPRDTDFVIHVPSRYFGPQYTRHTARGIQVVSRGTVLNYPISIFRIVSDPVVVRRLLRFARAADRAAVPSRWQYPNLRGDHRDSKFSEAVERALSRMKARKVRTLRGTLSLYDLLKDYAALGRSYLKTF